jgi:hypothetical protein
MIFPDLVQLYQFHYFFRLNCYFLPLPRLLFIAIVAFMPVGNLYEYDVGRFIARVWWSVEDFPRNIRNHNRLPQAAVNISCDYATFYFQFDFLGRFLLMMPIFLWKLYRIWLFCFRMLSVGYNYSWHFLILCNFWQYFRDWGFYCMDSISRLIWSVLRLWVISCLVVHLLVQCG